MTGERKHAKLHEAEKTEEGFHMKKQNKIVYIVAVALDMAITIALLVISLMMLIKSSSLKSDELAQIKASNGEGFGFIGYLIAHTTMYFCAFVLPLFILLAVNIVGLVIYVRKETKAEPVKISDLNDEQKEALRKEILADLNKEVQKNETDDNTTK